MSDLTVVNADNVQIPAIVKEGWRCKALDNDRIMFTHPDHQPRIVEIATIKNGDELPRDTDAAVEFPPSIGGH